MTEVLRQSGVHGPENNHVVSGEFHSFLLHLYSICKSKEESYIHC